MDREPVSCVRNLGEKVEKYLSQDGLLALIHAFVTTRLDYCKSLMYGLPQRQISKLQNAEARLALDLSKFCHITPALRQLHWLQPPFKQTLFYNIHNRKYWLHWRTLFFSCCPRLSGINCLLLLETLLRYISSRIWLRPFFFPYYCN